jgi:hypothetical protein
LFNDMLLLSKAKDSKGLDFSYKSKYELNASASITSMNIELSGVPRWGVQLVVGGESLILIFESQTLANTWEALLLKQVKNSQNRIKQEEADAHGQLAPFKQVPKNSIAWGEEPPTTPTSGSFRSSARLLEGVVPDPQPTMTTSASGTPISPPAFDMTQISAAHTMISTHRRNNSASGAEDFDLRPVTPEPDRGEKPEKPPKPPPPRKPEKFADAPAPAPASASSPAPAGPAPAGTAPAPTPTAAKIPKDGKTFSKLIRAKSASAMPTAHSLGVLQHSTSSGALRKLIPLQTPVQVRQPQWHEEVTTDGLSYYWREPKEVEGNVTWDRPDFFIPANG